MASVQEPLVVPGDRILGSTVRTGQQYRVKVYNFKRPDKFSLEQIRTVSFVFETVARLASPVLSQVAGEAVQVRCDAVDQLTYQEFIDSIPGICALVPVALPPLKGPLLMEIDGTLAKGLVYAACGQKPAGRLEPPDHRLTEMECLVLKDLADRLMPILDEAWQNVIGVSSSAMGVESDPQFVQIVPPSEMIVLGSLRVTVGPVEAFVNFAIPFLTIEPVLARLSAQWWFSRTREKPGPRVAARAEQVAVDVSLSADTVSLPVSRLPSVIAGDPVDIPSLADGLAQIRAGGVPVAEVRVDPLAVTNGGPLTVRVLTRNPAAAGSADGGPEQEPLPVLLAGAVDSLTDQIQRVQRSVEQIRDNRDTLLDDIDPEPGPESHTPDVVRRSHEKIALVLSSESPEMAAFVIAGLTPELAALVVSDLDPQSHAAVIRAMTRVRDGDRQLHRKLIAHISRHISRTAETTTAGGSGVAAAILNHVPRSVEKNVMEEFRRSEPDLFEEIARQMFVFEDFVLVDRSALSKLVSRVTTEELALAMKGVQKEVSAHILRSVDDETAALLETAVDALGRVRRQDVEAAQRDMIEELRQLEAAGEVVVARPDQVIE